MRILNYIFWRANGNARDIRYYLGPLFSKQGFSSRNTLIDGERHIIYTRENIEFDFWWERGNRPVLFLKKEGELLETTIYNSLLQKHAPDKSIGARTYFIYSKLDKDIYFNEHHLFISNFLKSQ